MATGNPGMARLHGAVKAIAKANVKVPVPTMLGQINADLSLSLDTFMVPFPKGSYLAPDYLVNLTDPLENTGSASSHSHTIPRFPFLKPLAAGDRVLCTMTMGYSVPAIICRVVTTGTIGT